ncbi:M48 family metallopeptidase [Reinekea thalattae]|uniref:M48 family metallopeptidase n=2 Tax=Reinekea thalattae TaxID=2593301 RepID=A0A5C8Z797_9GAMM|nr:M48 family metallopeptidase [Reinekea thalattae]
MKHTSLFMTPSLPSMTSSAKKNSHFDKLSWREQSVKLTFSRRKTMALHVKPELIEVRAPYRTPIKLAQTFVNEHDHWIRQKLFDIEQRQLQKPDLLNARHIPFMGFNVALHVEVADKNQWQLVEQGLHCQLVNKNQYLLTTLADFYKQQAQFWLDKKTRELVIKFNLQHRYTGLKLRKTKTKWGHCSSEGVIQYNWLIMMAPEPVIDYLVAHEVAHLVHMNHSAQFWQLVEEFNPTYKAQRNWLNENGHRLTIE